MCSISNINCSGCTNSHRKMKYINAAKEKECFLEIIRNIPMPVPDNISLYLCWECTAELYRFSKFKEQVTHSYKILNSVENGSVTQISEPKSRLKTQDLFNVDYQPDEGIEYYFDIIKVETKQFEDPDIKIEDECKDKYNNDDDYHSNDEIPLTEICKKRKKKKVVNSHTKLKNEMLEYTEIELNAIELQEERTSLQNQDDYVNAMFRCERCILSFPNADDLKDHIHMKHERHVTLFKCKICECAFSSEVSFNYHMNRHTRRYQCTACSDRFTSKRSAVKHYNLAHCLGTEIEFDFEKPQDVSSKTIADKTEDQSKPASFACEFCPKSFLWRTSLRKHLETHRIENGQKRRPYCEPCKLSFTTTSNLQKHVKTSSKHQIQLKLWKLKESAEGEEAQTTADIRSEVNRARERYACAQCGARYQWRGNLLRHLKSHQAKAMGSLVCEPCGRSFSSIATYRQHMTVSKKHVTEDDFKFMCSQCGRRFATRTRLRDHVDWDHLKNYVHTCATCQKVFKSHTSLYLHEQVVHRKQPEHLCDHCGKPFPNQAKLRSHVTALHSGAAAYRCGDCGARFAWHSCLSRHVRRTHRKRNDAAQNEHATNMHATAESATLAPQNAHATVNTLAHVTHTQ